MTTSSDPDEIRADIEQTRAELSANVDALADTANPKNIARRQVGKVKDAASEVKDYIMGSASDTKDSAADALGQAGNAVRDQASAVAELPGRAKQKTRGNPLAAGLIAFGAGLLISGLFPSSQKEQQAISDLQDKAEPLKEKATQAVKEVAENLREPAQQAVESVKSTASEGVEAVKSEGAQASEQVRNQVSDSKDEVQSAG